MHLIPEVAHPIRLRRPSSGSALATANHPVKPVEPGGKVDRFEQRFDREEAERGRDPSKIRDAARRLEVVLDRRTEPDVRPAVTPIGRKPRRRVLRPFAQKHPDKRRRRSDQIPQLHTPGLRRMMSKTSAMLAQKTRRRSPAARASRFHRTGPRQYASLVRLRSAWTSQRSRPSLSCQSNRLAIAAA